MFKDYIYNVAWLRKSKTELALLEWKRVKGLIQS